MYAHRAHRFGKKINDSAKGRSEVRELPRRVSKVNSKMVKHDTRKTVFIRVGAERDAIIPLKLRTANNAGRCVASHVINALVVNACVRASVCAYVRVAHACPWMETGDGF